MAKRKLQQFAEYTSFPNTFDFAREMKGIWNAEYFKNNHPITIELGCGKGEYSVALAQAFPERNFIGIDIKSNRMWRGAKTAIENNLTNVAFMRASIHLIEEFFDNNEVSEIWITFPDPFPKDKHDKHRLTHPRFLERYKKIIKPDTIINFKTDDDGLFQFTIETLEQQKIKPLQVILDVHHSDEADEYLKNIKTYYEKLFSGRGRTIKFLKFKF
ncbi:MAG: tRNA (guanosine(46)-N7)-methyltransferase TrmB [Bacteroidetes bacterium]|nr:tRNA (guanosine(46)-N7)-methyltransferase TrmB [Bacteroidota bacterium]